MANRKNCRLREDVTKSGTLMQWFKSRGMLNIWKAGNRVSEF
jgi:hypothetical protein